MNKNLALNTLEIMIAHDDQISRRDTLDMKISSHVYLSKS